MIQELCIYPRRDASRVNDTHKSLTVLNAVNLLFKNSRQTRIRTRLQRKSFAV